MCAIVGAINNKEEYKDLTKSIFKTVMIINEERGKDSTGVLAINRKDKSFSLFKDIVPSSVFMNRKKFRQVEADVWIGHTRLATTGKVTERNAHPLNRKNIFIVHNGVINNHVEMGKEAQMEYEVDSEVLIPMVEKEDWDSLQKIRGSANFIAWNKKNNLLYVLRHDNPLYAMSLKEYGILVFSSMSEPLEVLCTHYGGNKEADVFEFPDDHLEILDLNGVRAEEPKELEFVKGYEYIGKDYSSPNRQLTYPSKGKEYGEERYPSYYGYGESIEDDDYVCEVCGCDIGLDEFELSDSSWGFPLCYNCLATLGEIDKAIRNGEKIDFEDKMYKGFLPIIDTWYQIDENSVESIIEGI